MEELLELAEKKYASGDYKGALDVTMKMSGLGEDPLISHYMGGMLVDIGRHLQDEEKVREAVDILEKDLEELVKRKDKAPQAYYNLANGYYYLYEFKWIKDHYIGYLEPTELYKVREYLLKAIELKPNDEEFLSQIWTNLGNCFDNSGRGVDALECYEKALECKPDHGMAMGNKGTALFKYASVSGRHRETFLHEAYTLITEALKSELNPGAKKSFQYYLNLIKKYFADDQKLETPLKFSGCKTEITDKFEEFLVNFCLENKLYLNLCNVCQKCDVAIGDTVGIRSMIVSLKSSNGDIEPFYSLSNFLNHIKMDYVTARFLLIQSQYKGLELNFVDRRLKLIDTLDYSLFNIRVQLVKTAFRAFYDILDKTSIFINNYLQLGIPEGKLNFRNVWYSDRKQKIIHEKMKRIKNFSLNAIFDIFQEFESEKKKKGRYKKLRDTRNALTHRFVNIRLIQEEEDEENMMEDTLFEQTGELARIVRNVIIYLTNFVYLEEKAKKKR